MDEYRMVRIIWYDATHQFEMDLDDLDDDIPLATCNTIGHLIKETKDVYVVAQELSYTNNKLGFRHLFAIPRPTVTQIEFLDVINFKGDQEIKKVE